MRIVCLRGCCGVCVIFGCYVCVVVVVRVDGAVVVRMAGVMRVAAIFSIFWRSVTILGAVIVIASIFDSSSGVSCGFIWQGMLGAVTCGGCGVAGVSGCV